MSENVSEIVSGLQQELRRGSIILCVLSQLAEARYGYSLVETLEEKGIRIEPGTLYPLLRRLEGQGLLKAEWETSGAKPRKYYTRSEAGDEVYHLLAAEWYDMEKTINSLIEEGSAKNGKL